MIEKTPDPLTHPHALAVALASEQATTRLVGELSLISRRPVPLSPAEFTTRTAILDVLSERIPSVHEAFDIWHHENSPVSCDSVVIGAALGAEFDLMAMESGVLRTVVDHLVPMISTGVPAVLRVLLERRHLGESWESITARYSRLSARVAEGDDLLKLIVGCTGETAFRAVMLAEQERERRVPTTTAC